MFSTLKVCIFIFVNSASLGELYRFSADVLKYIIYIFK